MGKEDLQSALNDFDKSLSEEDKKTESYLDWSDETLGRFTRYVSQYMLTKTVKGFESIQVMAAVFLLINAVESCNAGELTLTLKNVTGAAIPIPADYKIIVEKIEK